MSFIRQTRLLELIACFALVLFGGALVGDAIMDAKYGCAAAAENSGDADGCTTCLACAHASGMVMNEPAAIQIAPLQQSHWIFSLEQHAIDGPPARIDHPPQLA